MNRILIFIGLLFVLFLLVSCKIEESVDAYGYVYITNSDGTNSHRYEAYTWDKILSRISTNSKYLITSNFFYDINNKYRKVGQIFPDSLYQYYYELDYHYEDNYFSTNTNYCFFSDQNFNYFYCLDYVSEHNRRIIQINMLSKEVVNLTDSLLYGKNISYCTITPDNQHLVIYSSMSVYLFSLETHILTPIVENQNLNFIPPLRMNQDNTFFYYQSGSSIKSFNVHSKEISTISNRGNLLNCNWNNSKYVLFENGLELMELNNNECYFTTLLETTDKISSVSPDAQCRRMLYYNESKHKLFLFDKVTQESQPIFGSCREYQLSPDGEKALLYSDELH